MGMYLIAGGVAVERLGRGAYVHEPPCKRPAAAVHEAGCEWLVSKPHTAHDACWSGRWVRPPGLDGPGWPQPPRPLSRLFLGAPRAPPPLALLQVVCGFRGKRGHRLWRRIKVGTRARGMAMAAYHGHGMACCAAVRWGDGVPPAYGFGLRHPQPQSACPQLAPAHPLAS